MAKDAQKPTEKVKSNNNSEANQKIKKPKSAFSNKEYEAELENCRSS